MVWRSIRENLHDSKPVLRLRLGRMNASDLPSRLGSSGKSYVPRCRLVDRNTTSQRPSVISSARAWALDSLKPSSDINRSTSLPLTPQAKHLNHPVSEN